MREILAISTILSLLAYAGVEPRQVQAKSCETGVIASLMDGC